MADPADLSVSEPGAKPKPNGSDPAPPELEKQSQPQTQATHILLPVGVVAGMNRLLTRLVMDGQEAGELLQAIQQTGQGWANDQPEE